MFDGDDMMIVPKDSIAMSVNILAEADIPDAGRRAVLPNDVPKSAIGNRNGTFIMDFRLCRRSKGCGDYPVERGCIGCGSCSDICSTCAVAIAEADAPSTGMGTADAEDTPAFALPMP